MKIKPKRYIVWSTDKEIDMDDPCERKWYIEQVLQYGRAEDVSGLNWSEIKILLPQLNLPRHIKQLWEHYFNASR